MDKTARFRGLEVADDSVLIVDNFVCCAICPMDFQNSCTYAVVTAKVRHDFTRKAKAVPIAVLNLCCDTDMSEIVIALSSNWT